MSSKGCVELPPRIDRLYKLVADGKPKRIRELYECIAGAQGCGAGLHNREMQMWIGSYITKLNRRIRKQKKILKPAEIKGTYALVQLEK